MFVLKNIEETNKIMETNKFKYLGYFQTNGSPVCITTVENLKYWHGAEDEKSTFWPMIKSIDISQIISIYRNDFLIFTTETGNFLLFKSPKALVIVEALYIEDDFLLNFSGIMFEVKNKLSIQFNFKGKIVIFDSALTVQLIVDYEAFYKVGMTDYFDTAIINFQCNTASEVEYKSDKIHLSGVMFQKI